jgi:S1-C subfamily serine protease
MTDEGFEQPIEGSGSVEANDTHRIPLPGIPGPGIPLPPVGEHFPNDQVPSSALPTWVPAPIPAAGAPDGSYALGALAGNPQLRTPSGPGYGGPPTNYGFSSLSPPPPPEAQRPVSHRPRVAALIGAAAVIALAAGVGIGHVAWTSNGSAASSSPLSNSSPSSAGSGSSGSLGSGSSGSGSSSSSGLGSSGPSDVSSIAAKVDPGLVDINTTLGYQQVQAAGTGIVLTASGEILTNNHVINGATTISVTDVGNGQTYSASVVGYNRTNDIAVLQLHGASGLQTATIGNSANASVGQDIVGIGNAGGTGGTPSAAGGTVTALNQSITASDSGDGSSEQLSGLIQTNANIQPGDSGGPLVDSSGRVLGVDTAASAGFSFQSSAPSSGNEGYAIPINEAISIAKEIESGTASSTVHIGSTAFLGVEVVQSSCTGVGGGFGGGGSGNGTSSSGAVVCSVVTSSPAQGAGLAPGDVITSLNNQTVGSPSALTSLLAPLHPGDKVTIGWSDASGQSHTASVQLSSGPPQ